MNEKIHQSNNTQYQIRVDGVPKYYPSYFDNEALNTWSELCAKHEDCYVDIVRVNTEIIMSQYDYNQMKKHFKKG